MNLSCEACTHAAFDDNGIVCTRFSERIENPEKVATDCGEFDDGMVGVVVGGGGMVSNSAATHYVGKGGTVVARSIPRLGIFPPPVFMSTEREQTLTMEIGLRYFGKDDRGDQLVAEVLRTLRLDFGKEVTGRRTDAH